MKILFVSAEVAPFVSVGGLSQVMYFLPKALKDRGHDVRIFTAGYGTMKNNPLMGKWKFKKEEENLLVPVENDEKVQSYVKCSVSSCRAKKQDPITYFLENSEYYKLRANVFGYMDDHIRFALLSKGCLEWLLSCLEKSTKKKDEWFPDVIQCNDWHTGYLIDLARRNPRYKKLLEKTSIVFTVHNFSYQGNYDFRFRAEVGDDGSAQLQTFFSPKLQKQNALKRGLLFADAVNTVSQTHALEVLTPEYAHGLDDVLSNIRGKLSGILNGLDTTEFDPARDPIIFKNFTAQKFIRAREENKKNLQKQFLLPIDVKKPLLAISGRLSQQKGWDLLLEVLPHLLVERPEVQLVVLGTGEDSYRERLMNIQKLFPKQLGLHLRADFRLPRRIFAGADMFLIPSLFEPGGIVALEALRYGAIPIVRRTGGLNDIIEDFNPGAEIGNGFSFKTKNSWSLYGAIIEALTLYSCPKLWHKLVQNALRSDFSWEYSAREYEGWYERVQKERKRATSLTPHPAYGLLQTPIQ